MVMKNINKRNEKKRTEKIKLSKRGKEILHSLEIVADGIGELFGRNCEVVLHSFEDMKHTIVKIVNGNVTGRKVGAPLTDLGMTVFNKLDSLNSDVIGSYYTTTKNGTKLKTVSVLIRDSRGKPIGFLSINFNLSAPLEEVLKDFAATSGIPKDIPEHFVTSAEELVNTSLELKLAEVNKQKELSPLEKNKLIVAKLYDNGIFDIKTAVDLVATDLGLSRYTIYNYIREAKLALRLK